MGLAKDFTCDRCQKLSVGRAPNWFKISQPEKKEDIDSTKLEEDQYFCTLKCLLEWAQKAVKVDRELKEGARMLSPRGKMVSGEKGMEDLYI